MYDFDPLFEFVVLINVTPFILVGLLVLINVRSRKKKESKKEVFARKLTSTVLLVLIVASLTLLMRGWIEYLS